MIDHTFNEVPGKVDVGWGDAGVTSLAPKSTWVTYTSGSVRGVGGIISDRNGLGILRGQGRRLVKSNLVGLFEATYIYVFTRSISAGCSFGPSCNNGELQRCTNTTHSTFYRDNQRVGCNECHTFEHGNNSRFNHVSLLIYFAFLLSDFLLSSSDVSSFMATMIYDIRTTLASTAARPPAKLEFPRNRSVSLPSFWAPLRWGKTR